jgi:hypothetical protein
MASAIKDLLSGNPAEILDELNKLRDQEQLIAHERELVERVLEMIMEGGGPGAEWLADPARGLLTIGPLRTQILRVMDTGPPDVAWQPREIHEQLVAHGNNKVTLDNVRSTMGRMHAGGELLQPEPPLAAFIRPPSHPSAEETDDDA